jgi:vancomycin permeability regulator SanA
MGNTCNNHVVPTKNKSEENFVVKGQTKVVRFNDKNLYCPHLNLLSTSEIPYGAQKVYISNMTSDNMQKAFNESIARARLRAKSVMDDAVSEDMRKSQGYSIVPYVLLDT